MTYFCITVTVTFSFRPRCICRLPLLSCKGLLLRGLWSGYCSHSSASSQRLEQNLSASWPHCQHTPGWYWRCCRSFEGGSCGCRHVLEPGVFDIDLISKNYDEAAMAPYLSPCLPKVPAKLALFPGLKVKPRESGAARWNTSLADLNRAKKVIVKSHSCQLA